MKKLAAVFIVLALLFGALALLQKDSPPAPATKGAKANQPSAKPQLMVYCAAGLKKPVEAVADAYRKEFGVDVQLQFGGTGTLLSQIRVAKQGDLFIAADAGSVKDARKYEAVREAIPMVRQYPVIAVQDGNPKKLQSLADLMRDDVKAAVANPGAASIGKSTQAAFGDQWDKLAAKITVMKPTVTELAADLSLGTVDAAVIWNSTVPQFKGITAVRVPELDAKAEEASVTVLTACKQPQAALKFARFMTALEKGGAIFKANGFEPVQGDKWVEKPELILYSGGVNRPAIEKLLKQFADHEGVTVTTVFNGCGILCATMKTMGDASSPQYPDAYYACDICFVPPVADVFPEAVSLTETDIGIITRKGNPKGVQTLADLAQPGLKVGLCNAEQSTLGYMTKGMLKDTGLLESIRKNVVVEVPTADFLVNQMRAGALDAAIVYRVNAQPQAQHIEYLPIKHEGARAVQPFAVRKTSPNHFLGQRLLEYLQANRSTFESAGFIWNTNQSTYKSADIVVPEYLKQK